MSPAASKTPEPMVTKIGTGDEVRDPYLCAKFYYDPIRDFCSPPLRASAREGVYKVTIDYQSSIDQLSVRELIEDAVDSLFS